MDQNTTNQTPKSNNNVLKIVIIAAVVVVISFFALIALLLILVANSKKINLNDYVTIKEEGYNGYGTVSYEFDTKKFLDKYGDSIKLNRKADDSDKLVVALYSSPANALVSEMVGGSFDQKDELSNGDTVVFTWDCDDEKVKELFGYKLKYKDIEYKVKDLEEVATFNPFDGVSLEYYGIAPNGNATVVVDSADSKVNSINFVMDNAYNLSNGDVIKVSMSEATSNVDPSYYIEKYGAMPVVTEKDFTVDGLGFYVTKEEDIPDDLNEKMKSQAEDVLLAHIAKNWSEDSSLNSADHIGNYFLCAKDQYSSQNMLYYVFKVNASIYSEDKGIGDTVEYYTFVRFDNIIQMGDGTGSVNLANSYLCSNTFSRNYPGGWYGYNYYFNGYEDLDTMFNQCVTTQIDRYTYTNTVSE